MSVTGSPRTIDMSAHPTRSGRAFTVVELIVVIAIIAVLIGLVFVGMSGVRNAGARTETLNSLRHMIAAYSAYSAEHRQHLMPGYIEPNLIGVSGNNRFDLRVRTESIGALGSWSPTDYLTNEDTAGYVWRLAPYLDNAWRTFMADYRDRLLVSEMNEEFNSDPPVFGPGTSSGNELGIAAVPSFGLNSIFVGGDTSHGGSDVTERHPWLHEGTTLDFTRSKRERERLAAVRFTEVRNPARLIVFGPTARADASAEPEYAPYQAPIRNTYVGYVELRPPYVQPESWSGGGDWSSWTHEQWKIGTGGRVEAGNDLDYGSGDIGAGLPIARWGRLDYPVANLDGSTTVENLGTLSQDMRRWSPFVTGIDPPLVTGTGAP